jgi:hypothetical protein
LSQSSPFKIADFWPVAGPGRTLCLLDGTYTGAASMINPPPGLSGTQGHPVTVRALNDGGVLIDGQFGHAPVAIYGNAWFVLEGFNAAHSHVDVVAIGDRSDHIIVRRVIAWDSPCDPSPDANNMPIDVFNSANVLLEDVAMWGCGRKALGKINDRNTTIRRCFGMRSGIVPGGKPVTSSYQSQNSLMENCIGTINYRPEYTGNADSQVVGTAHFCGGNPLGCDPSTYPGSSTTNRLLGSIAYMVDSQHIVVDGTFAEMITPVTHVHNLKQGMTFTAIGEDNLALRRRSANNMDIGLEFTDYTEDDNGPCAPGTCTGIRNAHLVAQFAHNTDSLGPNVATATNTVEEGTRTLSQFVGGNLLQHTATTRPPFGAWLAYRYHDGVMTTTRLWPWPMNDRIKHAMVQSGYDKKGGLDGKGETDLTKLIFDLTGDSTGMLTLTSGPISGQPNPPPTLPQNPPQGNQPAGGGGVLQQLINFFKMTMQFIQNLLGGS